MYISIQNYGQPILLLWHDIKAYVTIIMTLYGTILYENCYKHSGTGPPDPPSIIIVLNSRIQCTLYTYF